MPKEWWPVKMCRHWQVQSLTKVAHMSKETCQFSGLSIKYWGANCPKLARG